jgi:hypothetical protein
MIEVGTYGYCCFSSLQLKSYILFVYSCLRFKFHVLCFVPISGIGIDVRKMKSGRK